MTPPSVMEYSVMEYSRNTQGILSEEEHLEGNFAPVMLPLLLENRSERIGPRPEGQGGPAG
jgi:hypothetical protein